MLGTSWRPSKIEDAIYDILEDYEVKIDVYEESATEATANFLHLHTPAIQWQLSCSSWPDGSGGTCAVAWIEDGTIHSIMFDYISEY